MSPARSVLLTATAAAALVAGLAAEATAAPPPASADVLADPGAASTTWAGWAAPGPSGVGEPVHVTARDGAFAVVGRASGGIAPFLVQRIDDDGRVVRTIGRVPVSAAAAAASSVDLVSAGGRTLYLADGCGVRRSADLGATWRTTVLPGCGSGADVRLTAVDERTVWASSGYTAWRTVDGGATWTTGPAVIRGPLAARSGTNAIGQGSPRPLGGTIAETRDGGATAIGRGFRPTLGPGPDGAFVNVLPGLTTPVLRSDGTAVVGFARSIGLVPVASDPDGNDPTFVVPGAGGPGDPRPTRIVCEPGGACIVDLTTTDGGRSSVVLRDRTFGPVVAALPAGDASSPGTAAIVGTEPDPGDGGARRVVATTDLGATPYRTILSADGGRAELGADGLLAIPEEGTLRISTDRGRSWTVAPDPAPAGLVQVSRVSGTTVALAEDGTLRVPADGAWAPIADLTGIAPRAIAASGDALVVVGDRGIARLTDPAAPVVRTSPSAVAKAGRFDHVTASGRVAIAWSTSGRRTRAARSGDGGATWRPTTLPGGTSAVDLATPSVAYALAGRTLHRSADGGRRFATAAVAPRTGGAGPVGAGQASRLDFSSAKRGALITPAGPFVTGNGGRTLELLAVPGAVTPPVATVDGSAIVAQDPLTGTIQRHADLLGVPAPRLSVRRASSIRRGRSGARAVTVSGRLPGVGAGEPVAVLGIRGGVRDTTLERVVRTDDRGRFRAAVRLTRSQRGVQVRYRGVVRADRTVRGATSTVLRVR
ncbi:hypothetical protein [Patulibacter sp.]|uniref:hypothetical protein n=1 Tax=Patulibacter sp. TaxID=1912859 RepID=UPI00271AEBEC|nr:hypothetical protein [Patulibacter sp.]MDO9410288.1 hypothetical protein [Patulibacter sp.]